MEVLAQYPITEAHCKPHCGRPVICVLGNGDEVYGILDKVENGHVYLRPIGDIPPAAISQLRKSSEGKRAIAKTSAWGPWGWYGGWPWVLPLFALTALLTFPFFW